MLNPELLSIAQVYLFVWTLVATPMRESVTAVRLWMGGAVGECVRKERRKVWESAEEENQSFLARNKLCTYVDWCAYHTGQVQLLLVMFHAHRVTGMKRMSTELQG
jgi:hypothetical protein